MDTIEHWYGIPDAALKGSQNFPPAYNYNNESDRFRWAGRLWREADPDKLEEVLEEMVEKGVGWIPTFSTYEACRDMTRARNLPWFEEYLHPALETYFAPSPARHGAFSWGWSTEDEIAWKENYRIWMKAVRDFADMGGVVGAGDDAGFIYTLYGFTFLSELELLQEAGFHPIDVIQCATGNNAKLMGLEKELGRVRQGFLADLILVDENPLANLKFLYPTGVLDIKDGKAVDARRHQVDDQGRHRLRDAEADAGGPGDGRQGARGEGSVTVGAPETLKVPLQVPASRRPARAAKGSASSGERGPLIRDRAVPKTERVAH